MYSLIMCSTQQYPSKSDGTSKGNHRSDRCIQVQEVNATGRMDTSLKVDENQQMAISSRLSTCSIVTIKHGFTALFGYKIKQEMLRTHNE